MLVLRHKSDTGMFASDMDANSKNKADPNADLYSRLDELESMRNPIDGKLHFSLCYVGKKTATFLAPLLVWQSIASYYVY